MTTKELQIEIPTNSNEHNEDLSFDYLFNEIDTKISLNTINIE